MKFRHEIVVDADQQSVWAAFDDPANMKAWQPTLESVTRKSGQDGHTRWAMYGNHSFKGIFRFLGIFLAGAIRKRNENMMNNFKLFAETRQAEGSE